jgi:serine/threonine protein kinase/Tfp pilus assembly protein PilF
MAHPQPELRAVFCAALDCKAPLERAEYLDQACQGMAELRARVEALLQAHQEASGFLQEPSGKSVATIDGGSLVDRPGSVIGPYKLLEQIGEGGFGVVFMAEQTEPVRRKVALKVLKPGMDTRQVVARFEAERQALALMDHPNIARVFDGGETAGGRPYFVMELVKGLPITDYCDQSRLTPRERLGLFVDVCQAVQHAHQKGIIHRDLKPSNVLATLHDGTPLVKVIDFGIAKALGQQLTDKTLFTGFAQLIGTPLYMSPEQAALSNVDVDTRSDIYSLGVLLYELLTGTTPFEMERLREADYDEIRRIIREEEPPRPSTRLSELGSRHTPSAVVPADCPGESLANDRTRSVPTPAGSTLATVAAQRRTEPARLMKQVRGELDWIVMKCLEKDRNRRYETASALAADLQRYLHVEPVLACPPSPWYRLRKFAQRNKTGLALAGLAFFVVLLVGSIGWGVWDRAAREEEVRRDRAAQLAAADQKVRLALDDCTELRRQAKWPEALEAVKRAEGNLVGGSSARLARRVRERRKDVTMVLRLDKIRLPRPRRGMEGSYDSAWADASYSEAFRKYGIDLERLKTGEAARRIRGRTIWLELTVALDNWARKRKASRKADDTSWKRLLAVARAADTDQWRNQVRDALEAGQTKVLNELAASPKIRHQPVQTLSLLGESLDSERGETVLRLAQRTYPGDFWISFQLGWVLTHRQRPQLDEAIRFCTAAVAIRPRNGPAHLWLASTLRERGRVKEAVAEGRQAVKLNPEDAAVHGDFGYLLWQVPGKLDEAIKEFRRAIKLDPGSAVAHYDLGTSLDLQGKAKDAIAEYRKAIELKPDLPWPHNNLGTLLMKEPAKLDEAIAEFRKAIRLAPDVVDIRTNLATAYRWQGKLDDAIAEYREILRLKPDDALALFNLGLALRDRGEFAKGLAKLKRGHELLSRNPHWPANAAQKIKECERLVELDARMSRVLAGQETVANARERIVFAKICYRKRQFEQAAQFYQEALAQEPGLADDLKSGHRYNAARCAALAAIGAGKGTGSLVDEQRARRHRQARQWLSADLQRHTRAMENGAPAPRAATVRMIQYWLRDPVLRGVREDAGLAKLPMTERHAWVTLWSEVRALLTRAQSKQTSPEN